MITENTSQKSHVLTVQVGFVSLLLWDFIRLSRLYTKESNAAQNWLRKKRNTNFTPKNKKKMLSYWEIKKMQFENSICIYLISINWAKQSNTSLFHIVSADKNVI